MFSSWKKSARESLMARRVTIMLDDDLNKKIRLKQAKQIEKTGDTVSFSRVLNDVVRNYFKNEK